MLQPGHPAILPPPRHSAGQAPERPWVPIWLAEQAAIMESELERRLPTASPGALHRPMRHAVLGGGKRLRPLLVLATARAVAGSREAALRAACAVELIHAYSLVHDDMPCMDNDVLRRGQPTTHVAFGEGMALLAGDALQTLAFEILTQDDGRVGLDVQARMCAVLARAAGYWGMAGGQAIDITSTSLKLDGAQLRDMHRRKTGALIRASVMLGAASGPADADTREALAAYAEAIGLAFQIVDDILDATQTATVLGKTAGKDAATGKATYVTMLGLDGAKACADEQHRAALEALDRSGLADTRALAWLADMISARRS